MGNSVVTTGVTAHDNRVAAFEERSRAIDQIGSNSVNPDLNLDSAIARTQNNQLFSRLDEQTISVRNALAKVGATAAQNTIA